MGNPSLLSISADILAIISLLLSMYFYYGSRNKEIEELKSIVNNKSDGDFEKLKKELAEIKTNLRHLNEETFDLLKNQVSFMQQQVGTVGNKVPTKPDVEILDVIMKHKVITVQSLCMSFNQLDKFIVVKYVEQFNERGTIIFDGSVIRLNENKIDKEEESGE